MSALLDRLLHIQAWAQTHGTTAYLRNGCLNTSLDADVLLALGISPSDATITDVDFTLRVQRAIDRLSYPEHNKLHAVKDRSQAIGSFLEWLREKGWHRVRFLTAEEHTAHAAAHRASHSFEAPPEFIEDTRRIERLLAEYFEIDLDKLEAEKQAMLAQIREANEPKE